MSAYNGLRPIFLSDAGHSCIEELRQRSVSFVQMKEFNEGQCVVRNPVKVNQFSSTRLNSPVVLSCSTAIAVDKWLNQLNAQTIRHLGSYNCRVQRRSRLISEHGFGTAIDISEVDGARVSKDWGAESQRGEKLSRAAALACEYFVNVITPDDDALHKDHLHLDVGFGLGCKFKPAIKGIRRYFADIILALDK